MAASGSLFSAPVALQAFEFHDSEVSSLVHQGDDVVLRLSAANAITAQAPTMGEPCKVYVRTLLVCCIRAQVKASDTACFGRLSDGQLHVHGLPPQGHLNMSAHLHGPMSLTLSFTNGTVCTIDCGEIRVETDGPLEVIESFRC